MRNVIASVVAGMLLLPGSAYAQVEGSRSSGGGGKGALIGLLVGAGAGLVYGLTTDYCKNPVGEYTEGDQAKFCAMPIAAMVGGATVTGYLIGRGKVDPRPDRMAVARPGEIVGPAPLVRLRQPRRSPTPEDRFFRGLFAVP